MTRLKPRPRDRALSVQDAAALDTAYAILHRLHARTSDAITDPAKGGELFRVRLAALTREVFSVAFLDTRHRVIAIDDLFSGTVDGCEVHPRIVVREALLHNAAAVLVAHNHPSGNPEPSAADRTLTIQLKQSLALVEVRLLDHFIVTAANAPVSLAARGWI